jgi:protein-disulfide isomerase
MNPSLRLLAAAAVLVLALVPARVSQAQSFSPAQRSEIEAIVKEYLLKHPELLQEIMNELDKRQAVAAKEGRRNAVKTNADTLFNSTRHVVLGNPQGDVTMVEFFDYNCSYCRRALADMVNLMKGDPKLRVVLKEFPVLGQASVEAAQVSIAVHMQDRSGKKYLEFHHKLLTARGQADRARALAVAKEIGLDVARIQKDMASEEVRATLQESFRLADALGLNGTPSYVIGSEIMVGAVGFAALKEKVNVTRCAKAIC